jgi:hypothetical protein
MQEYLPAKYVEQYWTILYMLDMQRNMLTQLMYWSPSKSCPPLKKLSPLKKLAPSKNCPPSAASVMRLNGE